MINRRKHKRYIRRCEVEFASDGVTYRGIVSDFSLNGLFIRTNYPLPLDTVQDITVHLPDGLTSQLTIRVIRAWRTAKGKVAGSPVKTFKNGMGVEIIRKDVHFLHFIRSILDRPHE
ncbi:MAG TPA: PilZ domain-containing protein [Thermodesulfovibrionales bacterium]|nr:PilZ domain-containing protein [Thermodesulfovibrionales bacterium]